MRCFESSKRQQFWQAARLLVSNLTADNRGTCALKRHAVLHKSQASSIAVGSYSMLFTQKFIQLFPRGIERTGRIIQCVQDFSSDVQVTMLQCSTCSHILNQIDCRLMRSFCTFHLHCLIDKCCFVISHPTYCVHTMAYCVHALLYYESKLLRVIWTKRMGRTHYGPVICFSTSRLYIAILPW